MEPQSSGSKRESKREGKKRIHHDTNEKKTDKKASMADKATSPSSSRQPIDDLERQDFQKEKEILQISIQKHVGKGKTEYRNLFISNPSYLTASEKLSLTSILSNKGGCGSKPFGDSNSTIRNMVNPRDGEEASGSNTKPDFMQKLLAMTSEKKDFPKGKMFKAEVYDSGEGCPTALVPSLGSLESIGSISSIGSLRMASTSNADKLLGLDDSGNAPGTSKSFSNYRGTDAESDDDPALETCCTCVSSESEGEEEEEEYDSEANRHYRKRRRGMASSLSRKRHRCEGSSSNWSPGAEKSGNKWSSPGPSSAAPTAEESPPPANYRSVYSSPEMKQWIGQYSTWTPSERIEAIDALIEHSAAEDVRHMMQSIEPLFQRDFISLLPKEVALTVLSYLQPKDLLQAAQTCRYWKVLAEDNLLWKAQCRRVGITTIKKVPRSLPRCASPWKAAYMRQHLIENNWVYKPINQPLVLRGHDDHVITCLQFYGNRILSGSDDTTLKLWSAVTGHCLRTLVGHSGGVWSSQMVGDLVISGSTDRTLRVWNAKTGKCLKVLAGHTSTVRCMHLFKNSNFSRVVSGSRDATLRLWSIPDGRCLRVLIGHMAAVRCVQYDGKVVVSGAYDYFVKVWNPDTGECLHTLAGHTNRVYSLQFDGVHVVSGSLDTSIRVWDVESGQLKHTLTGHQSLTSGMELQSNTLVSGNADSTVKVWDINTGHCLHTLSGPNKHQSAVTCLQTSNRFVITSSDDGTVKLWDVHTGEFIRNLVELGSGGSGGVVWRIRASATKLICAVGSRNGTEETKLLVLDFDIPGTCRKCDE